MSALIPAPGAALATLPESARILAAASLTTNTRRAYSGALARLDAFLAGRPLEDGALAAYLATLHDAGRPPSDPPQSGPNTGPPACLTALETNFLKSKSSRTSPGTVRKPCLERRRPINIWCGRKQRDKPSSRLRYDDGPSGAHSSIAGRSQCGRWVAVLAAASLDTRLHMRQ